MIIIREDLGDHIKRLRLWRGLTQRQLTKIAGVAEGHIAKIEGYSYDPRISAVANLLRALGIEDECGNIAARLDILERKINLILQMLDEMLFLD